METPYSKLVQAMRDEGTKYNGFQMAACKITSIDPITINYENVSIYHNIYCSEAYVCPEDPLEELLAAEKYLSPGFKEYLTDINRKLKMQPGDLALVQRVGNSFYVIGKVVVS